MLPDLSRAVKSGQVSQLPSPPSGQVAPSGQVTAPGKTGYSPRLVRHTPPTGQVDRANVR